MGCGADEVEVGFAGTREDVVLLFDFERVDETGREEEFLVRLATRRDEPELLGGVRFEDLRGDGGGGAPIDGLTFDRGLRQAALVGDVFEIQPVRVGQPDAVDVVVFARGDAVDRVLARADDDIRAGAAVHVDGLGFLQKPDAHLEPKIVRG